MGTNEQLSHALSDWVGILNNAKKILFFIQMLLYLADLYFYSLSVTITVLNLFTKILTVFFQMPIFGVVEI